MKLASLLLAATALATSPVAADETVATDPSDVIVIPGEVDFGEVAPAAILTERIWLVNTSEHAVRIESTRSSCGCTSAPGFRATTIQPLEIVSVNVIIRAPKDFGKDKRASIRFLDEFGAVATGGFELATADSAPAAADDLSVEPSAPPKAMLASVPSDLGEVHAGLAVETTAWLLNSGDSALGVRSIKSGCGCTTVLGFETTTLAPATALPVRLRIVPKPGTTGGKTVTVTAVLDGTEPVTTTLAMTVVPERVTAAGR